ncbi:MAG: DEAD/DEAH box helicase [Candidatus Thiodiazotropha lotti]|nr:DEAD/DEAH box helicase [Candidatus Thiodiazotropha lotti]
MNDYFQKLFKQLSDNGVRASVSGLQIANTPLRRRVAQHFSQPMGVRGSLLADPVFEATFPWKGSNKCMQDLAGNLLEKALVEALHKPPKEYVEEYQFPRDRHPYTHQLQAWKTLSSEPKRSVVVTSGTGSGKTECFLVPVLNDLVGEYLGTGNEPLEGVRALFLYPLNALINSQKDRLNAWTDAFGEGVRYCLYNGLTPERPARGIDQKRNAVESRLQLRASPPPILVTNATMLEYMLVRIQDQAILNKSQGKLRWIVLDEAHTYLGSQAAELSLLLRRVMHAFGVDSSDVRFVATSATIGDKDSNSKLQEFLAQMAGVPTDRVEVIGGDRYIPVLPEVPSSLEGMKLTDIEAIDAGTTESTQRYMALSGRDELRRLRAHLTDPTQGKPVLALSEISGLLLPDTVTGHERIERTLRVLDVCSGVTRPLPENGSEPFLPLRAHIFGRTVGGLWACSNRDCSHKTDVLNNPEWGFGEVYFSRREKCECGAPVFDLVSCNECNSIHLLGKETDDGYIHGVSESDDVDDFARELDPPDEEEKQDINVEGDSSFDDRVVITAIPSDLTRQEALDGEGQRVPIGSDSFPINIYLAPPNGGIRCPTCETKERARNSLFMRKILGAPFQLATTLPTLLEFSPPKRDKFEHPWDGRRMITFTDSRQGTARTAANLQLDAERTFLRSQVYHTLLAEESGGESEEVKKAREKLHEVEKHLVDITLNSDIRGLMESMRKDCTETLAKAGGRVVISWNEMATKLATNSKQLSRWIANHYRELDVADFNGEEGAKKLAELLLAREFLRRPKRQNSLESMGLVQVCYPSLDEKINKVPATASSLGMQLPDWRDFLKLILDWHVRASQAVGHETYWGRWIGNRFPFRQLASPKQKEVVRGVIMWPAVRGNQDYNRFVRLIRESYKIDPSTVRGKDQIDSLMQEAWDDLQIRAGILRPVEEGRFNLDLRSQVAFRLMDKGWICPITRRILDTTLKGTTPFLPPKHKSENNQCENVDIPVYLSAFGDLDVSRKWLSENEGVAILRDRGIWSGLHDRVIENSRYFSAAEHSAQQAAKKLRQLETSFKEGNLNILSCSTTMEMGVDIGGISVVAMNNVPPNPANYLQRAGRAGRRAETRSVSYTLCKDDPHGHQVMNDTRWPFDTPIPLPHVSLQSAAITQRHVNSLLLGEFLKEAIAEQDANILRLNCAWFFLAEKEEDAPCRQMQDWCEYGESRKRLESALMRLVRQSVLEGRKAIQLFRETSAHLEKVIKKWRTDYNAQVVQLTALQNAKPEEDTSKAIKAVEISMHRLKMEYLLGELATQGFLPGYGFPNGVVSFNTVTAELLNKEERQRSWEAANGHLVHREDNRQRSRNFPSRSRATAIREYAPGADVVIDGVVYRSEGISLSWQKPMNENQVKEPQGFFHSWICQHCGASGIALNSDLAAHCSECSREIKSSNIHECMQPNGFSVEIGWQTHNDITRPHYLPVHPPTITAEGDWIPLVQEKLGRFRSTVSGKVLYSNSGATGSGYAICLECGRAADMPHSGELPEVFQKPHKRLRGGVVDGSRECSGSHDSWKIKPNIHLVHHDTTDVFELQLKNLETKFYLNDKVVATTLAVSFRHAAALVLGINDDELGYSVSHMEIPGGRVWSILLYDTADGGAGYASSIGQHIIKVAGEMYCGLECAGDCDSACHQCLLSFDTQYQSSLLNRHAAKEWLTEDFPSLLELPLGMRLLGATSAMETMPLYQALDQSLQKVAAKSVRIYLGGNADNWEAAWGELRHRIVVWMGRGLSVELAVYKGTFDQLGNEAQNQLAVFGKALGAIVSTVSENERPPNGILVAETSADDVTRWACADENVIEVGPNWGRVTESPLIVAHALREAIPVDKADLVDVSGSTISSDMEVEVDEELHGTGGAFGERFWDLIQDRNKDFASLFEKEEIASIQYSDRYLNTPLVVTLLLQVLKELDVRYPNSYGQVTAQIKVEQIHPNHYSQKRAVWNDWLDERDRERAIEAAFEYVGLTAQVGTYSKQHMPHFRALEFRFSSGKVAQVRLDEGWGYWEAGSGYGNNYNFSANAAEQGRVIAEWSGTLAKRRKKYRTVFFLSVRDE